MISSVTKSKLTGFQHSIHVHGLFVLAKTEDPTVGLSLEAFDKANIAIICISEVDYDGSRFTDIRLLRGNGGVTLNIKNQLERDNTHFSNFIAPKSKRNHSSTRRAHG